MNKALPDRLLNRSEVANMLGVSYGTVDNYVRRGLLKRYRIKATGRRVFKKAEIEQFLTNEWQVEPDNEGW